MITKSHLFYFLHIIRNKSQKALLACVFFAFFLGATAQSDAIYKQALSSKDYERITQAITKNREADQIVKEVVSLNQELLALENDFELTQREFEKQSKKIEAQISKKQQQAYEIYRSSNKTIYEIIEAAYKEQSAASISEDAQLEHELAREAKDEADNKYKASEKATPKEKTELLNEAVQQEQEAIGRLTSALGLLYGVEPSVEPITETPGAEPAIQISSATVSSAIEPLPVPATTTATVATMPVSATATTKPVAATPVEQQYSPSSSAITGTSEVVIDESIISRYNDYINDPSRPEPMTVRSVQNSNLDYRQSDSLARNYWEAYNTSNEVSATHLPVSEPVIATSPTFTEVAEPAKTIEQEEFIPDSEERVMEPISPQPKVVEDPVPVEEFIYKIQLAESKAPINQRMLKKIYDGEKQVQMLSEGGWYKYVIGDFYSFNEANNFKQQYSINEGYVVRYKNDIAFIPPVFSTEETTVPSESQTASKPARQPVVYYKVDDSQPEFRVQIAASHVPLSIEQIATIYSADRTVHIIEEDGWLKYQVRAFTTYDQAWRYTHECNVENAFIGAYQSDKKIALIDARKAADKIGSDQAKRSTVYYYVQIAASRYRLSEIALSQRYRATYPYTIAIESGWFKYQVPAGTSYEKAREIKANCGVSDAFIVGYYEGKKQ